jgi:hypothetical protein
VPKVIKGNFTKSLNSFGWGRYIAQEQEPGGKPDLERPPDVDVPNFDKHVPDEASHPGSPPFTGEDVEDTPRPDPRRDRPM